MTKGRTRLLLVVFCAVIAAAIWGLRSGEVIRPRPNSALVPADAGASSAEPETTRRSPFVKPNQQQIRADRPALTAPPPPPKDERSPLADKLHAPDRTGVQDLGVVMNLFAQYRIRFQGFPVGEDNAAFMNALTGNNPGHLAFISRDHPAMDAQGQLLDRWGEPFFFHLLGHDALQIRSAGPDRELYTPDDLLIDSPVAREATKAMAER